MEPVARGLSDAEVTALAKHFAARPARVVAEGPADAKKTARGRTLAAAMQRGQCHLPDYSGRDQMPRLAGQREDYLVLAMAGYRDNTRTGADTTMAGILRGMSDADIAALAHYLARRK